MIVSSPSVPNPVEVRYAWQSFPAATLFNGAGLRRPLPDRQLAGCHVRQNDLLMKPFAMRMKCG